MIGGRSIGDGITIFGSNNSNNINNDEGSNQNTGVSSLKSDFILNLKEKYNYPYIFIIYFDKEKKSYFIRPYSSKNNDNRILYIKLSLSNLSISLSCSNFIILALSFLGKAITKGELSVPKTI